MKKSGKILAVILLVIISTVCIALGAACSSRNSTPDELPDLGSTERKEVPTDGSTPLDHTALDNIAYMAYVLDNQPYYHSYAKNSTKSTGYEQITQTWKDYKSETESGTGSSVMVCSDLSYSALVKSATQSCFVGGTDAYMRTGSKPAKTSVATDIDWSGDLPSYYDRPAYLAKYGEFSTELSVYVISADTVISAGNVVDNKDGTYTQKYSLNQDAAAYYQYGMKTRGSLKSLPVFSSIEITFTFDAKWQVLSSYCEEKAEIAPGALGGMKMTSTAKTETVFDYSAGAFDNAHYAYYNNYFANYVGKDLSSGSADNEAPEILDLLGNGFSQVVDPEGDGQQFDIYLTVGETDYAGKIYLKLADMSDILGSLEVRLQLGKEGCKQDLYAEFANGQLNLYYSDDFALTADVGKVAESVNNITRWVKGFTETVEAQDVAYAITGDEEQSSGIDVSSLLNAFELTYDNKSACVKLKTDDLLGLGIGINVQLNFDRQKDENGSTYSFNSLYLNSVAYQSQTINFSGTIVPDNTSAKISHNPSESPADIADYIDGVLNLLNSKAYEVEINLDGSCESIGYLNGLKLNAVAKIQPDESFRQISVTMPISVSYKGITAELSVYYTVSFENGGYGDIYINLTSFGGKQTDAKIYCNVKDTVDAVSALIDFFKSETSDGGVAGGQSSETATSIASIINAVLGIDFGSLITELKADETNISIGLNVDDILNVLNLDTGISFGNLSLCVTLNDGTAELAFALPSLGLTLTVNGCEEEITVPETEGYADITDYIKGVTVFLNSQTYELEITLDGASAENSKLNGLELTALAQLQLSEDFNDIRVNVPVVVSYNNLSLKLTAYYEIELSSKNYGEVYLSLNEFCGKAVDAKIYGDIKNAYEAVKLLINRFTADGGIAVQAEEVSETASVIDSILSLDFTAILEELKADGNAINVSINADEILGAFGVSIGGIKFGVVSLGLGVDSNGELSLEGCVPEFGLEITLCASDNSFRTPDKRDYADVTAYVNGIIKLLDSKTYEVALTIDGSCESIEYINGLKLDAVANVRLENGYNNISVFVPMTVTYKDFITVCLEAYYTVNISDGSYGKIYINLTEINGRQLAARVYADIKDLKTAIEDLINVITSKEDSKEEENTDCQITEGADKVSGIVDAVLGIDFAAVIKELRANADGVELSLDADAILSSFKVNLGAIALGTLTLNLGTNEDGCITFGGKLPALGASLLLSGSDSDIAEPSLSEYYLDLTEFATIIEAAYTQADLIIKAQDIEFELDTTVTVDGIAMSVKGEGEVIWKDGNIRVALTATLTIKDTAKTSDASESVKINFIYDETEGGETADRPLVRITVNGYGLEISRSDIDNLSGGFNGISNTIGKLLNGVKAEEETEDGSYETLAASYALLAEEEVSGASEENTNALNKIIDVLLAEVSKVTVVLNDKDLLITYAANCALSLRADGGLGIDLNVKNNDLTEILDFKASVKAGNGTAFERLNSELDGGDYEYCSDGTTFLKAVYNFMLDVLDDLTVGNLLGSDTYSVEIVLNGTASGISQLDGINATVGLYYSERLEDGKLIEADLDLDIKGTTVFAKIYYLNGNLYVELNEIAGTKLNDMAFTASADDIYSAVETLINIVTSDAFYKLFANINSQDEIAALSLTEGEDGEKVTLTGVLANLLSIDINSVIKFGKLETGENTLTLNPDSLISLFGSDIKIGTVYVEVNPRTHAINASITGDTTWLNLSAEAVADSVHSAFKPDGKFIDIGFVSTLLEDLRITLNDTTKSEEVLYTLTGSMSIDIIIVGTITINNVKVTIGLDKNGEFYFTLTADLESKSFMGFAVTKAMSISVTYSNGYITMGRELGTSGEKYKVMTLSYLLDNLLDKDSSPVRWLLGTSDFAWGKICDNVKLPASFGSGLTDTEIFYLYDNGAEEEPAPEEDKEISLSDILLGLSVKNGGYVNTYGSYSDKFGLSDNYYGFNLDLSPVIGSVFSELCAAIVRKAEGGLKGVDVYAAIQSYIKLTVKLDGGFADVHAEDYFVKVTDNNDIDFDYYKNYTDKVFGMYSTEDGSYTPSEINKPYNLTVYDKDGNEILNRTFNSGSTIYLYEDVKWLDDEQTRKLIYADESGKDMGLMFNIKADTVLREKEVGLTAVNFLNVDGTKNIETEYLTAGSSLDSFAGADLTASGYTFAGWYDEGLINHIDNVPDEGIDVLNLYAKYVKTVVTETNGIIYSFVYDIDNGGYYKVIGFDKNAADKDYSLAINTLYVADKVNGYTVTAIGKSAFKSSETGINLKNVVVPATVTAIEAQAFMDNYGMLSVVLLADVVHLGGTSYTGDDRYVFFGCSETSDGVTSLLKIYYKAIIAEDHDNWNGIRQRQEGGFLGVGATTKTYKYELNEHLFPEGTWAYVEYQLEGGGYSLSQLGLENYLTTSESYDFVAAKSAAVKNLNALTSNYGYINAYTVSITGNYSLSGLVKLTVTLSEQEAWYLLTVTSSTDSCAADYVANENIAVYDGNAYVKAGTTVNLTATADAGNLHTFKGWSSEQGIEFNGNSFTMPACTTTVTANWGAAYAENIYVYSEVAFSYDNTPYYDNVNPYSAGEVKLENAVLGLILDPLTTEENYTFLGWAIADGETLTVRTDILVENHSSKVTYYAIWAKMRTEVTIGGSFASGLTNPNAENSGVTVTADTAKAAGTEGWYSAKDTAFISRLDTLTTGTTVLNVRLKFSLNVSLIASNTNWGYSKNESHLTLNYNDSSTYTDLGKSGSSVTGAYNTTSGNSSFDSFDLISEGNTVQLYKFWTNAIVITVLDGNYTVVTYLIKGLQTNGISKDWRTLCKSGYNVTFTGGSWTINPDNNANVVKDGDNACYEKSGASGCYYLANIQSINSNASFGLAV